MIKQPIFEQPVFDSASQIENNLVPMVIETTSRGERESKKKENDVTKDKKNISNNKPK